jgi:two-component system sensor histidine kinase KdpD
METQLEGRVVRVSVPDTCPAIAVDSDLLQLSLKHLIDNASKYSSADSAIEIYAEVPGNRVLLRVCNRGEGIPEEEQIRIFERSYRGCDGRNGVPGSGMGLTIAREIVKAHGGDLCVESSPGQGAEFIISLPFNA